MKMKVDLSKFKLKHKDDKFAHLQHPDGHEVKVAIAALHPMNRKNLDSLQLSEGGEIEAGKSRAAVAQKLAGTYGYKSKAELKEDKGSQATGESHAPSPPSEEPSERAKKLGQVKKSYEKASHVSNYAEGGEINPKLAESKKLPPKGKLDIERIEKPLEIERIKPKHPVEYERLAEGGKPEGYHPPMSDDKFMESIGQQPQMASNLISQPEEQQASQEQQPQPSLMPPQIPAAQQSDEIPPASAADAYATQVRATKKIGEGEAELQQAKAHELKATIGAANDAMTRYQESLNRVNRESQDLMDDIRNFKIDPNRYMGSMDTGDKIASGIALALGGLGASLTGGPNQALEILNKNIDRDIDSQKAELGKKHTLLSANLERTKDMRSAMELTRMQMNDIMKMKLEQADARAQSPLAKQRAQLMIGQLQAQMAPMMQQQALRDMMSQTDGKPVKMDPTMLVPAMVPKEHQEPVYKEIERAQNTRAAKQSILNNFDSTAAKMKSGLGLGRIGTAVYTPAERDALMEQIGTTVSDKVGTVREAAMKLAENAYVPKSTDTDARLAKRREELEKYLNLQSAAPRAKSFGLDLDKFSSTTRQGAPQTAKRNGELYEKVEGGWKKAQ